MTILSYLLSGILWLSPAYGTAEKKLVLDLANNVIKVGTGFSGAEILIFGASRDPDAEVLVKVEGPKVNLSVHEQGQYMGVWTTTSKQDFKGVPEFYAHARTPLSWQHLSPKISRDLEVRAEFLKYTSMDGKNTSADLKYRRALTESMRERALFADQKLRIRRLQKTLFSIRIPVPSIAPKGQYNVDVTLIKNGQVLESQRVVYTVEHAGLSRAISNSAHEYPAWYGIFAVIFAIISGYLATVITRRS